ncbi:MAG: hypothetical protein JSS10_01690 [Verrucomicrobia bacterium]|nr:hypothetical protein [Verrucomicrobiota bacterium]
MRFLALLMATCCLYAQSANQSAEGYLTYGNEILNSVQVNGFVTLNGTTILQQLQVNGSLSAHQAQIGEMMVNGQASLNSCTVKNKSTVIGSLSAMLSTFNNEITLTSDHSAFDGCTIASIRVSKNKNSSIPPMIELKGKTKVTGLITFESGNGQVMASPDSQISAAQIAGGTLQKGL